MRKIVYILLAFILVLGLTACNEEEPAQPDVSYNDGTYAASASGYGGEIELEVVIDDGRIDVIQVVSHQETESIADPAFSQIIDDILAAQSADDVDTVSGATETSNAILEAVQEALTQAR